MLRKLWITLASLLCLFYENAIAASERETEGYVSPSAFRIFCDQKFTKLNAKKLKPGNTIYLQPESLGEFIRQKKQITTPYILVTHYSDEPIPGKYSSLLEDPNLIAWFGINVENYSHPKLHPIPIGIANRSLNSFEKYEPLYKDLPKTNLLYMNFSLQTSPQERGFVYNTFINAPFCTTQRRPNMKSYLMDLAQSKFVLSPRGAGLDCYRTWESLIMGAFPIVKSSTIDPLFEGLPVLIIHDWNEITEEFLNQKWEEMSGKEYQWEKLYTGYWFQIIASYKEQVDP